MKPFSRFPAVKRLILILACAFVWWGLPARAQQAPYGELEWQQVSQGLPQDCQCWIFFSPQYAQDETMFATHELHGLYRSRTGGESWESLSSLVNLAAVSPDFAADQTLFGYQWISSVRTLVRSTDGGLVWTPVWSGLPEGELLVRFSPDFGSDHTVFLASDHYANGGVWRSTNGGVSWSPTSQLLTPVVSANMNYGVELLVVSPLYAQDHTLWAVTHNQMIQIGGLFTPFSGYLYTSIDGGSGWEAHSLPSYGGYSYNLHELRPTPAFAENRTLWGVTEIPDDLPSDGLLWTSTNLGASWQQLSVQPAGATNSLAGEPASLSFSPDFAHDRTVYFGSFDGVYRSFDAGLSWELVNFAYTFYDWWSQVAFSPDYASDETLFLTMSSGMFASRDSGETWDKVNFSSLDGHSLVVSPGFDSDQTLWTGAGAAGLFKSVNGGQSWQATKIKDKEIRDIAPSPDWGSDPSLWLATMDGVYRTPDGGQTLITLTTGITDTFATAIGVSPSFASDQTVLAGTYSGVFRTTNGGQNWSISGGQPGFWRHVEDLAISPAFASDQTAFVVYRYSGVYRTSDGGASWQPVGLSGFDASTPAALSVVVSPDFSSDHTLWAGTEHHGVYVSTNGGQNWSPSSAALDDVRRLLVTGSGSELKVWAAAAQPGSAEYSLYSQPAGGSWEKNGPELQQWQVLSLAYAPGSASIFAGVQDNGLWRGGADPYTARTTPITPAGGSLSAWDGSLTLTFPAGAVSADTQITMTLTHGANPLPGLVWLQAVELSASQGGSPLVTFLQPFTLRFNYAGLELGPYAESSLSIFGPDGNGWTPLATSRDAANDQAWVESDHFSTFLLAAQGGRLYLPMLRK